jgi:hypothetical protein
MDLSATPAAHRGLQGAHFTRTIYDTGELFLTRADLQADVPELIKLFAKFGPFVHVGTTEKKSKSVIVYHAAPRPCYGDYCTFDGTDFSDVDLGGGATMHIEESAKYLGSIRWNGRASSVTDRGDAELRTAEALHQQANGNTKWDKPLSPVVVPITVAS